MSTDQFDSSGLDLDAPYVDQHGLLEATKSHIQAAHAGSMSPGHMGAVNPATMQVLLADLQKYGPGLINALTPLLSGISVQSGAAVLFNVLNVFQAGAAAGGATGPATS